MDYGISAPSCTVYLLLWKTTQFSNRFETFQLSISINNRTLFSHKNAIFLSVRVKMAKSGIFEKILFVCIQIHTK